jgi:hypothetical protein
VLLRFLALPSFERAVAPEVTGIVLVDDVQQLF